LGKQHVWTHSDMESKSTPRTYLGASDNRASESCENP
jgi:hypothetical protein